MIVEVALLLYGPLSDPRRDPRAAEIQAILGDFPRELADLQDGSARGLVILEVHFGHSHPIINEYLAVHQPLFRAAKVMTLADKPGDWLDIAKAGKDALNTFVDQARAHVERI